MTIAYERERYRMRIREGLCGACGRPRGEGRSGLSTCRSCRDLQMERMSARPQDKPAVLGRDRVKDKSTGPNARNYESDEARFSFITRAEHADNRGTWTHERERQCAHAYRVERYNVPKSTWEVVIYANPLPRAEEHAKAITQSYKLAEITHYSHVRIVDKSGAPVADERV